MWHPFPAVPAMTRAHFVFVAALLKRSRDVLADDAQRALYDHEVIYPVANELVHANPAYDLRRFLEACGVDWHDAKRIGDRGAVSAGA